MKSEGAFVAEKSIVYEFAEFRLDGGNLLLSRNGETVPLAPKACEVLLALVRGNGRVVSKQELLETVWADTFVEEANLTHHISALRKALGEDRAGRKFIETIPRRGYRFVAPIEEISVGAAAEVTIIEKTRIALEEEIEISDAPATRPAENRTLTKPILPKQISNSAKTSSNKPSAVFLSAALLLIFAASAAAWFGFFKNGDKAKATDQLMTLTRVTNSGKVGASSISPDGKFVVYSRNFTEGAGTLFIRQIETSSEIRLATHEKGTFGTKEFSADGAFVYYIANDEINPDFSLYRVPVLGGQPIRLLENLGSSGLFSISPDGTQAAFFRGDSESKTNSLIAASIDGSRAEQILLTKRTDEISAFGLPAWSPDGKSIAFPARLFAENRNKEDAVTNVLIFDLATSELRNLTDETWAETILLRWMPDGSGIVLIGTRPPNKRLNQIYFVSYPAGAVRRVTADANNYGNYGLGITADGNALAADVWEFQGRIWAIDANGDASSAARLQNGDTNLFTGFAHLPNGSIVYSARSNFNYDLWTMPDEGVVEPKPLTPSDAFYDGEPAAAPDGSFIVFVSDRAGKLHLFRAYPDGTDVRQLTFGESFNNKPDISPDGNWIVYASSTHDPETQSGKSLIYKIPSSGGTPVQLTDYDSQAPAFSPDGGKISCILPVDRNDQQIAIVSADGGKPLRSFTIKTYNSLPLPARWTADGKNLVYRQAANQTINLWKQNIDGGAPVQLTDFKNEYIFNFAFTHDRKRLLLSRGNTVVNVVIIKNFKDVVKR
ncbi:MAG: winged helix-turn-helix domain-containing protein [Acidobacteriota bacterium]|nr:winged helix-turn-helix domain-containing protein [Acidobacteriota bacterium]